MDFAANFCRSFFAVFFFFFFLVLFQNTQFSTKLQDTVTCLIALFQKNKLISTRYHKRLLVSYLLCNKLNLCNRLSDAFLI